MSVPLRPARPPEAPCPERAARIAPQVVLDPRIPELVAGFDAPFYQAGLAGFSDAPMRIVARRRGCPYCVTEALLDQILIGSTAGRRREAPDVLAREGVRLGEEPVHDHPIAGQLMGSDPEEMASGARLLVELGYDVIDVNFACPVKKIARRRRGGHFLASPRDALAVLRAVREAVPAGVPTTVKLRRGSDETVEGARNFEAIFEGAYDLGYAWVAVHARTVAQKYAGPANWRFLADLVRRYPDRLIFGSGDVWSAEHIFALIERTGVHAVAVARGGIGDPWIFRRARKLWQGRVDEPPQLAEQGQVLREHLTLNIALHGDEKGPRLLRKFAARFAARHPAGGRVRERLVACVTPDDWRHAIAEWYGSESAEEASAGRDLSAPIRRQI